jgi:hypothetical protein
MKHLVDCLPPVVTGSPVRIGAPSVYLAPVARDADLLDHRAPRLTPIEGAATFLAHTSVEPASTIWKRHRRGGRRGEPTSRTAKQGRRCRRGNTEPKPQRYTGRRPHVDTFAD